MIKSPGHPQRALLGLSLVAFVAIVVLLAACDGDDEADTTDDESAAEPAPTLRRECYPPTGSRPLDSSNHHEHVHAGPVTFFGAGAFADTRLDREYFRQGATNWSALKTVTQVRPAAETTVTVTEEDRGTFRLIYDPENFRANQNYRRQDGHVSVVFGACADAEPPRHASEFVGGFVARSTGCFTITVVSEQDPVPARFIVNLGMGNHGCPMA